MIYQERLTHYQSNKGQYLKKIKTLKKFKKSQLDEKFRLLHEEVFEEISCLKCANCCKTISPIFRNKGIERISHSLRLKSSEFIKNYLHLDVEGDYVLNQSPCAFLGKDNYCSIYDVRPKACREYPHTNHTGMRKHLHLVEKNLDVCPAVVEIIKRITR